MRPVDLRDVGEIERALGAFAQERNGGVIVMANPLAVIHRERIITLAARQAAGAKK